MHSEHWLHVRALAANQRSAQLAASEAGRGSCTGCRDLIFAAAAISFLVTVRFEPLGDRHPCHVYCNAPARILQSQDRLSQHEAEFCGVTGTVEVLSLHTREPPSDILSTASHTTDILCHSRTRGHDRSPSVLECSIQQHSGVPATSLGVPIVLTLLKNCRHNEVAVFHVHNSVRQSAHISTQPSQRWGIRL